MKRIKWFFKNMDKTIIALIVVLLMMWLCNRSYKRGIEKGLSDNHSGEYMYRMGVLGGNITFLEYMRTNDSKLPTEISDMQDIEDNAWIRWLDNTSKLTKP